MEYLYIVPFILGAGLLVAVGGYALWLAFRVVVGTVIQGLVWIFRRKS